MTQLGLWQYTEKCTTVVYKIFYTLCYPDTADCMGGTMQKCQCIEMCKKYVQSPILYNVSAAFFNTEFSLYRIFFAFCTLSTSPVYTYLFARNADLGTGIERVIYRFVYPHSSLLSLFHPLSPPSSLSLPPHLPSLEV